MEESERTALIAIIVTFLLFGIKYTAAVISDSIALKAEAFHTLADLIAALTVFIGLKIAKRKTKTFPYGLYKIENLISIIIALVILYTGYEIISEIMENKTIELRNMTAAAILMLLSIIIALWFTIYEKKIGERINSPILVAEAMHGRMDVFSNVIVLLAVLSGFVGFQLDRIAAFVVVGFIARTGIQMLADGARVLLDASVGYDTLSKVEKYIMDIPQVVELKSLTGRNSGRFKFIEADIILKTHNLDKAHYIADTIEKNVKKEIKNVDRILIHYEPLQKDEVIYALPLAEDGVSISSHFGEASHFLLVVFKAKQKQAVRTEVLKNPFSSIEKGKGIYAAEYLVQKMVDFIIVKNGFTNKGPAYVFADSNIEVIITDAQTPQAAFEKLGLQFEGRISAAENEESNI
ncbi:cation diffusion facilitator family transporter [Anaerobium acetethylicum]|uniref:Cation diffusion facilitator family transporter n=1 Tax=Anaerobium acetethylicum TaxID=1619234 RepID=A0A1D3TVZ1_9FIRM|nr:cation diffusion facilitator family transporter [Anaerobium acetethylicum]SCP98351.1 cation diffusion facilitator family transporter [Anaerobium acetethylicum]